ncbi:MAG: hypothetical protein BWY25_01737 [Chloroflexi bacterium ADurb.Bin222]|nr:MAG: hypothetical protein BWY25_01737 [Chloroflexi bacterium ADurb.Bin222]
MVHPQDAHVGAAPRTALGDFPEGAVVDAQESYRTGGFAHAGNHQTGARAQTGEREAVAAAGLLNERGIAQRLEDAALFFAHVIFDGQDETRR